MFRIEGAGRDNADVRQSLIDDIEVAGKSTAGHTTRCVDFSVSQYYVLQIDGEAIESYLTGSRQIVAIQHSRRGASDALQLTGNTAQCSIRSLGITCFMTRFHQKRRVDDHDIDNKRDCKLSDHVWDFEI